MYIRWRNILGGIAILAFLAVYVWAAIAIGDFVPDHPLARLVYFGVVGIGWGLPLLPLLSWIGKDDRQR
ncbi:MAG TPA: DUF2842 domain-containing protein [Caulobacteraceae bacterium]